MYAVEKKFEIEMKLKKEMTNIQELKSAAKRSSTLASDVCNVLGACEQRLQQLETAVLPLYGDTARLQQIHQNMEKTVTALDHVINYYMVSRELADLIQGGPHTASTESLNVYLEALDKLAEAQNYFNKHNPQSVELENINQLYNTGVLKLESAFEDLLNRNTRPVSPTSLMDMIALEEDSSVDSVSVSNSNSSSTALETMRAAATWLSDAGRPPAGPLLAIRAPAALNSLVAFRDYLKSRSMAASPLMRSKNMLNRSDSTQRRTSKIQKVLEKRAINIMMKASQTLEQSTGLAIGPRRSINDSSGEEGGDEEAEAAGTLAAALCRLARREQRHALGLVPLPRLPALLAAMTREPLQLLAAEVERACGRSRRAAAKCGAGAAACWALLSRLQRLQPDVARALQPASPAPYTQLLNTAQHNCVRSLEEWVSGVRGDGEAGAVDGTVHQLAASALAYCHALAHHSHVIGPALAAEPSYARAASQFPNVQDKNALMLSLYMRKVLAQLNLSLRSKSEQYPDALKAIFLLNNTLYLLQGLQRSSLLDVLCLSEPECEATYRNMIDDYKTAYLQSWNKLLSHLTLEEVLPAKLRDKDRQMLKDKFSAFNREWEEACRAQRGYSVPDAELREALKQDNKQALLPPYTALHDIATRSPFSKHPEKYVKYTPVQIATQLNGFFDEAA